MCVGDTCHVLAEDATLVVKGECVCDPEPKRQMWVAWRSGLPGTWCPGVHANCVHNEIDALGRRSLAPLPFGPEPPISRDVDLVYGRLALLARRYRGVRWGLLETAMSYSGAMRRRYVEAERSLREDGWLRPSDWALRAFLKAEKLGAAKDAKPRMIFPRSPRFNLVVASWLKPLEHWLWGYLTGRRLFGGSNSRVVGKGLSPRRRANLIRRKMGEFVEPVCFEADGMAFEAHVTENHLERERSVYEAAYPGHRGLRAVLSHQVFKGTTQGGVKFSRRGGRASGDFNTGMGNTLIMLSVVVGVLRTFGVKFDVLVDGDNCIVFLEASDVPLVVGEFYDRVLASSGFEVTLEKAVSVVEEVRFGRSAPVNVSEGVWTMVREPWSVLSNAYCSHRWLREPVFGARWASGVARCELSLALGVPILQEAALSVLNMLGEQKALRDGVLSDYFVVGAWLAGPDDVREVTLEARLSFERAFGLSVEEQLQAEDAVRRVAPGHPLGVLQLAPPSRWDEAEPGLYEAYRDYHV